jgi:transposase
VLPLIPPAKRGGNRRHVDVRQIVNALMYILSTGCQWRALPKDLPPRSTVHDYFDLWSWDGTLDRSHPSCTLCAVSRAGRARGQPHCRDHRQPKRQERRKRGAAIDPPGYDAGKKIRGKKRHILVDTQGLLLHAIVHPAYLQDRDGGVLLATLFGMFPFLLKLYADGGYQGPEFQQAVANIPRRINVDIVKRSDHARGFVVLPKRWIVERTLAWLNRCRRLAKDWENLNRKALAFLRLASIRLILRKLCNPA